jgi:hypothetical protein
MAKNSKKMKRHGHGKTKKASKSNNSGAIMTIPELRRAFEHVEEFVELHHTVPLDKLITEFQAEWAKTFHKEVDRGSARAYVEHVLSQVEHKKPKHRRHYGGAIALTGAPLDYTTRPGLYITPGVDQGSYAVVPKYVDSGFWNPEQGRDYDPVPGQTHYVTMTPAGMGSNEVHFKGGSVCKPVAKKQRKSRKQQGGDFLGDILTAAKQAVFYPQMATVPPPSTFDEAVRGFRGLPVGPSPDASQRTPHYILTDRTPLMNGTATGNLKTTLDSSFFNPK